MNPIDRWKHAPTKEQWREGWAIQHGGYRIRRLYAIFGITSSRWKRLTEENKKVSNQNKEIATENEP